MPVQDAVHSPTCTQVGPELPISSGPARVVGCFVADGPGHESSMQDMQLPDDLPEGPSDNTTMTAVIEQYEAAGFVGQFEPVDGPAIRCSTCGVTSPATSMGMHSMRRLEGASDPADMAVVAAVVCPRCGTQGILVMGYGPAAEPTDSDVLLALRDRRHDNPLPADAAPGETLPH